MSKKCKHEWEFYRPRGIMIYVCFACGEITSCLRHAPVDEYAHLIASKDEAGELVIKDRQVA